MPRRLTDRPTGDVIILVFALVIAVILILAVVAVFVFELFHPDRNTDPIIAAIINILTVVTGAVIGYLAGRGKGIDRDDSSG